MALCRFEAKIISRSGGRSTIGSSAYRSGKSVTASAAYRNGEELKDDRTGVTYDYTRKRGVIGSEIMLPPGAPDWMRDRGQLWNAVEKVEKRADAQLARDHILTLPHELSVEQRRELTRAFVQEQFVDKGYAADIAWHAPHGKGDERNFHAHVMVVMRRIDGDGFARTKDRPPDGKHPAAQWKADLLAQREAWATAGADRLAEAGFEIEAVRFRAGHLTLEKQREAAVARGDLIWAETLDREAEPKQGPLATKIEQQGRDSHAGNDRREVKARNEERANLKAEHAAITAEIIDLEQERSKRRMDAKPDLATPETQHEEEKKRLRQAGAISEEAKKFEARNLFAAEEAKRTESKRREDDETRTASGQIESAKDRYADALADHYDIRDPYGSLAKAAMSEYGMFQRQQKELHKAIDAEQDPAKRELLQLRQQIEAVDYMAITSERMAGISAVIAGRQDASEAVRDRERAEHYRDEAGKLREQRSDRLVVMRDRDDKGKDNQPARDAARGQTKEPTEADKVRAQDEETKKHEGLKANETPEARPGNAAARAMQNREADETAAGKTWGAQSEGAGSETSNTPTKEKGTGRGGGKGR